VALDLAIPGRSSGAANAALAEAAAAIARLDEALAGHPLRPAFLYRARLEAVRRQAAVDGQRIDPWHLAALLEGLRLRMDGALRLIDRGAIFEAGRYAFALHQWQTAPDFDEEGEIRRAEIHLTGFGDQGTPLLAAAYGMHAWLEAGGVRPPIRAALIRHWARHRLLSLSVPLTGPAALRPDTSWQPEVWVPAFLHALAEEAADGRQLLADLERAWYAARSTVAGRRRDSHAAAVVDVMAATPLVSATSLAAGLGMAVKNAIRLLDELVAASVAVEVTHRSKRRLFGLRGMAPLGEAVRPPYRPELGRGRGRPPILPPEEPIPAPLSLPPLSRIERREFDYSDLERCMAQLAQVLRKTRRELDSLAHGAPAQTGEISCFGNGEAADPSSVPAIGIGDHQGHQERPANPSQG